MAKDKVRAGVIGDGAWGTAAAMVLARQGHAVKLWGAFPDYVEEVSKTRNNRKFLPGIEIPYEVEYTDDLSDLVHEAEIIVQAVPTRHLREVMRKTATVFVRGIPVVSLTKGIEEERHIRPSQIIKEELGPATPVAVLSGPSHAEEVAMGIPTSVVVASKKDDLAKKVQTVFAGERFRVYTSMDMIGVELAGALKNVIAVAAGVSDGIGFGDNAKAALLTRGMKEMGDLGTVLGGHRKTFFGLSGIGDLIVTCISRHGRNLAVGEAIGRGKTLDAILEETEKVAEGVFTVKGVKVLADKHELEMPISTQVFEVLYNGKDPAAAVDDLMTRSLKEE